MGVHHVADRPVPVSPRQRRLIQGLAYVVGGAFLLAAFLTLGLSENKSAALLLGLAAVVFARLIYINLPEYLDELDGTDNSGAEGTKSNTSENAPQDPPSSDRSDTS